MRIEDVNLEYHPDYHNIDISAADEEDSDIRDCHVRRKKILDHLLRTGNVRPNQTKLAERYDVDQKTIHRDIVILKAYMQENLGKDFESLADHVLRSSAQRLMRKGEEYKAARVMEMFKDMLFETGRRDKEPERYDVEQSGRTVFVGVDEYPDVTADGGDEEE